MGLDHRISNAFHVHSIVRNAEIELLATLRMRDAAKDRGHFRLFGTLALAIGHMAHPGAHRVQSWPFNVLIYYGANRENFVLVRPPGTAGTIFTPTPDSRGIARYCSYLIWSLKQTRVQTSTDSKGISLRVSVSFGATETKRARCLQIPVHCVSSMKTTPR